MLQDLFRTDRSNRTRAGMSNHNFWQGATIRLRAIEPGDAETFFAWNLDTDTARLVDFVWPPQSLAAVRAWAERMAAQPAKDDALNLAVVDADGAVVGIVNTHSIDRRVGTFRYGVAVRPEQRGRGYAAEAILLILRYFFEELRYQKVTASVYSCNRASIRLHERLGFQLEGRLRRMVFTQGEYFDELHYGMTCEEFAALHGSREGSESA
jgi:RimJ/RimL family protein N-acetyltransferase